MRLVLIALLLGVILVSVVISLVFNIKFVALATGVLFLFKGFKVTFLLEWLLRFTFIRVPQRILKAAVQLYLIDRETKQKIVTWFDRQQKHWRTHHKTRLVIMGIIALIFMGASAWWIGIWLLVIYEVETLLLLVWRKTWPMLSETAAMKAVGQLFEGIRHTRLGRIITIVDTWLEHQLRKRMEQLGRSHQRVIANWCQEFLILNTKFMMPWPPHTYTTLAATQPPRPFGPIRHQYQQHTYRSKR